MSRSRAAILRAGTAGRREAEQVLLAKHTALASFARAPTTAIVRVAIEEAVHVNKFQSVTVWRPEQRNTGVREARGVGCFIGRGTQP